MGGTGFSCTEPADISELKLCDEALEKVNLPGIPVQALDRAPTRLATPESPTATRPGDSF